MKKQQKLWQILAAAVFVVSVPAMAAKPFSADLSVGGSEAATFEFDNVEDMFNTIDPQSLSDQLGYNCAGNICDSVEADLNFRGLLMDFDFATDSGELMFVIDDLNFGKSFCDQVEDICSGTTAEELRHEAVERLKDFVKNDKNFLKNLLTYMAAKTPYDPVAGNPDSLMTKAMFANFNHGFTHKVSQVWGCGTTAFNSGDGPVKVAALGCGATAFSFSNDEPIKIAAVGGVSDIFADAQSRAAAMQAQNEVGFGFLTSSTSAPNPLTNQTVRTNSVVMPLSYTVKFDANPSHKLRFDLPITYSDTGGATSYALGFGLAYTYPVSDVWTLTPAVGVGATGSEDLGAAGGVGAYSLTSAYTWRLGGYALSMGNSIGQYESLDITIGDYSAGPDISNTVFTNGFMLTGPNSLLAKNLVVEYFFTDTRITGDTVYSDYYDEVGVALGYVSTKFGVINNFYKAGLSYLVGANDIKSIKLNLTARF
jgi:hypothetical protein